MTEHAADPIPAVSSLPRPATFAEAVCRALRDDRALALNLNGGIWFGQISPSIDMKGDCIGCYCAVEDGHRDGNGRFVEGGRIHVDVRVANTDVRRRIADRIVRKMIGFRADLAFRGGRTAAVKGYQIHSVPAKTDRWQAVVALDYEYESKES